MGARFVSIAAMLAAFVVTLGSAAAQGDTRSVPGETDPSQMLGFTVSTSGSERDTLGMWIAAVVPGGPADRARIQQGDRLAELNGMSLRISPEDVGRREAEELVARRFAREVQRIRRGESVRLRVYANGEFRSVTLETRRTAERPLPRRAPAPVENEPPPIAERSSGPTLDAVLVALGETQEQLRQLGERERDSRLRDSLAEAERELVMLQRRVREWQVEMRETGPRDRRESVSEMLRGLRVTVVSEDLVPYFGDEASRGLLVLEASDRWSPLRAGDVIVRIDDEPATSEALRGMASARRAVTLEVLRRKRLVLMTLDPARASADVER